MAGPEEGDRTRHKSRGLPDGPTQSAAKSSRSQANVKSPPPPVPAEFLRIRGARAHNLRTIDLDLPRGKLVVFTGVSGSGKSSLAFDTIFAEGQRRYIECLSPFVRQYLDQLPPPDVDRIDGLPPTISVSQFAVDRSRNPRSIVATLTEIHDYLRLLYARVGEVFCHQCGARLGFQSPEAIARSIQSLPEGSRILFLAPLLRGRKGAHRDILARIRREGFVRARIDGTVVPIDPMPELDASRPHDVEMVVDRQVVRPGVESRVAESVQLALRHGQGTMILARPTDGGSIDTIYNTRLFCLACQISYRDIEPRTFSFNSPMGACPHCQGLGIIQEFSLAKLVPDPRRTLLGGAIAAYRTKSGTATAAIRKDLELWAESVDWLNQPFSDLSHDLRQSLWLGGPKYPGIRQRLRDAWQKGEESTIDSLAPYLEEAVCPECHGARLGVEGRSVHIDGTSIDELLAMTIEDASDRLADLPLPMEKEVLGRPLVKEIRSRLEFLVRVGVEYVELDRPVWTLSGGEAQRIRLASCLGSSLNGACYVLDEPTVGLHSRDTARLVRILSDLRDRGNSVLVVEHDEAVIRQADWIVDLGPAAGRHGGSIVQQGTLETILDGSGLTAEYLSGRRRIAIDSAAVSRADPRGTEPAGFGMLTLSNVSHRNLKGIDVQIPLGRLVAITGVSGSGKSSLVMEVLVPAVRRALGLSAEDPGTFGSLGGGERLENVVAVDQAPIGRTPRSCPATYSGIFDPIRRVFARTREARQRGFNAARFSFQSKEGRCPECAGLGARRIHMGFLPDVFSR